MHTHTHTQEFFHIILCFKRNTASRQAVRQARDLLLAQRYPFYLAAVLPSVTGDVTGHTPEQPLPPLATRQKRKRSGLAPTD